MTFQLITLDKQQSHGGLDFPLAISPSKPLALSDALEAIEARSESLMRQLGEHGAILFRGLPLTTDEHFDQFVRAFGLDNFTYAESLSNAVRRNRTERVFTANEAPPSVSIFLHHEMAQTPVFPSTLFFFCEHAAESGGATPLCRSDIVLEKLREVAPDFIEKCKDKGVRYTNTMPGSDDAESGQGRSWRSTLSTGSVEAAEAKLSDLGYTWNWLEGDNLQVTSAVLPAVKVLSDGTEVFFNQLIAAFRGWKDKLNASNRTIVFGDGEEISEASMAIAIKLSDELSFDVPWQSGDVALVDNFRVMHGRRPFTGERRVLASLVA